MRVLIVGGGIGGLAAAIALRRAGMQPIVFERAPELREVGAGLTLWPNAIKALRKIGCADAIEKTAACLTRSESRTWNGKLLAELDLAALASRVGAPTLGIHRADLQHLLADATGPGVLRLGMTCTAFTQGPHGVTVRFANGEQEKGDLLIGADGLRSSVRPLVVGSQKPRYAGYTAWRGVADVEATDVPDGTAVVAAGRGSQAGFLPLGHGRTYWFATVNVGENEMLMGSTRAVLARRFADWYAPIPALISATDETAIIRTDIYDRKPATAWGVGRVTLLGDAAHPTTPNLGQGACQALEDAAVLARCLAERPADPATALRDYEAARMPRTADVVNRSWEIGRWLAVESRVANFVRDWGMRLGRKRFARDLETLVGYEV